jgi:hypothetical protein
MRKFLLTLMASLLSCSAASAFWPEATASSLEIGAGYRNDHLSWTTVAQPFGGGYSGYDDYATGLESHLKWRNLRIWQIEARGDYVTCDNLYLRATGDYGWITSGHNTDTDTLLGGLVGSETELSKSHSKTGGHVYDVDLAVGYQFKFCDDSFSVSPLVGYAWNGQHLKDRHLRVSTPLVVLDPSLRSSSSSYSNYSYDSSYGGEHSTYSTRWNGPFVGFDFDYRFYCDWAVFGTYEFHWARYHAKGHWGLRDDLPNGFNHHSKRAYGNVFDIGVKWDFCECWTLSVKGEFKYFNAKHGHDKARINGGNSDYATNNLLQCYTNVPLRHVKWHTEGVSLNLGMVF